MTDVLTDFTIRFDFETGATSITPPLPHEDLLSISTTFAKELISNPENQSATTIMNFHPDEVESAVGQIAMFMELFDGKTVTVIDQLGNLYDIES